MTSNFVVFNNKYNKWQCLYCQKLYDEEGKARECNKEHSLVLVPLAKKDLHRLLQFILFKQDSLLTEDLVRVLQKYNKEASIRRPEIE